MSAFLGPIHHWLFKKIRLHEELENNLIKIYRNKYGSEIDNIKERSVDMYGESLGNKPLEDIIDLVNIHQWLSGTISRTETRLAYLLAEVFRKFGEEAVSTAEEQFKLQGLDCGRDAKEKGNGSSAQHIYKALSDYLLEGMPCDRVNIITENSTDKVQWKITDCLHRAYWKSAGAPSDIMYSLRFNWIEEFVRSANTEFEYYHEAGDNADYLFLNEIRKSS